MRMTQGVKKTTQKSFAVTRQKRKKKLCRSRTQQEMQPFAVFDNSVVLSSASVGVSGVSSVQDADLTAAEVMTPHREALLAQPG